MLAIPEPKFESLTSCHFGDVTDNRGHDGFFVGRDDSHLHAAFVGRNNVSTPAVSGRIQSDVQKFKTITDCGANFRGVFSDTSRENDRIHAAKRAGQAQRYFFAW